MSALKITGLIIASGVLLGGCIRLPWQKQVGQNTDQQTEQSSFTGGLKDMLALGQEFKCETEVNGVAQTTFIKNGQFYSEMVVEGKLTKTIVRDNCMWNWQEGVPQGSTICFEPDEAEGAEATAGAEQSIFDVKGEDLPQTDLSCDKANVSNDLFTPPTDIKFTDIGALMKATPAVGTGQPNVLGIEDLPSQEELDKLIQQLGE